MDGVRLVAGGVRPQAVDILPAAGAPCAVNVTLNPWQPLLVACQGGPRATDRLTLQLSAAATGTAEAAAAAAAAAGPGLPAAGVPGPGAEPTAAAAAGGAAGAAPDSVQLVLCELNLFGLPTALP